MYDERVLIEINYEIVCMKNTCMTLIALIFCWVVNQTINYHNWCSVLIKKTHMH